MRVQHGSLPSTKADAPVTVHCAVGVRCAPYSKGLLREIEKANERKILYQLCSESPNAKWIIEACELAQQGAFDSYAIPVREIRKNIRLMEL